MAGRAADVSAERPVILSIFPGIDLLGRAFEEAWPEACLVRGPDLIWGGDVRTFHPPTGVFDGVIGGPPCAAFSRLRHLVNANGHPPAENLIPEFERVIKEAHPRWFLMENVPEAPGPIVDGYRTVSHLIFDHWVGGETRRARRFWIGGAWPEVIRMAIDWPALHRPDPEPPVLASGGSPVPVAIGGSGKLKRTRRAIETRKGAAALGFKTERYLIKAIRDSGLPEDFLARAPFTVAGKIHVIGNGVPMALGRAVAWAFRKVYA